MGELILGVSADTENGGSVHTQTFLNAVSYIDSMYRTANISYQIKCVSDDASFEGGQRAAKKLVEVNPIAVIGHYASQAARGALPIYRQAGIPLLLPAATSDDLTLLYRNAYRICPTDRGQADCIIHFLKERNVRSVSIHGSGSQFDYLKHSIIQTSSFSVLHKERNRSCNNDAVLVFGRYHDVVEILKERWSEGLRDSLIILSDDAMHPALCRLPQIDNADIFVCGFSSAESQDIYFRETVMAAEFVLNSWLEWKAYSSAQLKNCLENRSFSGSSGITEFINRENSTAAYNMKQLTVNGFFNIKKGASNAEI